MIYRTLYSYILRELLRVFFMTASALTTLMAFGGTFRPLTKQGIDVRQLLQIVMYMTPAMLAYAIPIAALFAAVLVYWRMSTDNELTACRAGGISFGAILIPALLLGVAVASVDMAFVNFVVPRYLQLTERAVRQDLGSLIVSQIGRQEKFQMEGLPVVVSANSAELQQASDDPDKSVVVLQGMAATFLDKGKPTYMAVAQQARIEIHNLPKEDATEVTFRVKNAFAFDPANGYKKYSVSLDMAQFGPPRRISSVLRSKAKFLNLTDLRKFGSDPFEFPRVSEIFDRIKAANNYEKISQNILAQWQKNGHQLTLKESSGGPNPGAQFALSAPCAVIDPTSSPEQSLSFTGNSAEETGAVKILQTLKGRLIATYTCDAADLVLSNTSIINSGISGQLFLRGHVKAENNELKIIPLDKNDFSLGYLELDSKLLETPPAGDMETLLVSARQSPRASVRRLADLAQVQINNLNQTIDSELHSRGSFALSCLTLVLFGAALGILLRGQNPLAVFVVGFVPAVILVLLITAGRQLTEGDARNVNTGIALIWAGNVVLLLLVGGVYLKLLRR